MFILASAQVEPFFSCPKRSHPPCPDLALDGVSILGTDAGRLRLSVTASALPEVMRRLAAAGVHHVEAGSPSLEDVFLAHYRSTER